MDYFCFIQSVVSYVENRLKSGIEQGGLESVTGFSLPHIREVFKECTRMPLAKYVLYRRVSNAAFDIVYTEKSNLNIALDYGFESYDTFTRAFKRITGVTPSEFRKNGFEVGRIKLTAGIFGPGIINNRNILNQQPPLEGIIIMKTIQKSEDSCVLYGVPKVKYCYEECTPFPSALKACLHYMGQDIRYAYLMAASGASFRLRWNTSCWDGGNVDIMYIYENLMEAFERSFKAAGRAYKILERQQGATKEDFIKFLKPEIDKGRPVIALGIIGPPEACIVTGYRDNGATLLGWNFFQDCPEFAKGVEIDESGYFICKNWWENTNTLALMSIGEEKQVGTSTKEILQNALDILTKEQVGKAAGGQAAFDAWAQAISDDSQFPKDAVLPMLFERLMCQNDAVAMIGEGRSYAAVFMEWVASQNESISSRSLEAARFFREEASVTHKMRELLGGWQQGEKQAKKLAEPEVRKGIVNLIMEAKKFEAEAQECLIDVLKGMQ